VGLGKAALARVMTIVWVEGVCCSNFYVEWH